MKILFESGSTQIGGAERVVLRVAQGIRKLRPDWKLDAVILCDRGGLEPEYQATFDHIFDGPQRYEDTPMHLGNLANDGGYDVVHCIDSHEYTRVAAFMALKARFVQNVFPNIEKSPFAPSKAWMNAGDLPYGALVTEYKANALLIPECPKGLPADDPDLKRGVFVVPNGIDTDFWTADSNTQRDIDVLWCARTDQEKGIDLAMELVPLLGKTWLQYRIITSEPDGPQEKLRELMLTHPTFRHDARLTPEELRQYFRRSKVFLSTSTVEGMPAVPLEAAACGCWPLVPQIDGLAEVFNDCPRFTYTKYDAHELADRIAFILRLCNHAMMDSGYGDVTATWLASKYSVEAMVRGYLNLYERLAR